MIGVVEATTTAASVKVVELLATAYMLGSVKYAARLAAGPSRVEAAPLP